MAKAKKETQNKKKGLSNEELIEKYEAGSQAVEKIIEGLLSKPNPNAPKKVVKRPK